jgi:hypothetical protein
LLAFSPFPAKAFRYETFIRKVFHYETQFFGIFFFSPEENQHIGQGNPDVGYPPLMPYNIRPARCGWPGSPPAE